MADALTMVAPRTVKAAGVDVELRRDGQGASLLVIHGEFGAQGWLDAHAGLARSNDVIVPSLPGYGATTRPDWIMGVHDLAAWVTWFARDMGVKTPVNLMGYSLGGWIAAEIACIAPQFINKLVLVGAMGLKPETGEIFDYFLEGGMTGLRRALQAPDECAEFRRNYGRELTPDETDMIEQHREMTCRIAWKPYMHSLTLPHLLQGVRTPTLVVWGEQDAIAPVSCGNMYARQIPGAKLQIIPGAGHMPQMERRSEFVAAVGEFLAR